MDVTKQNVEGFVCVCHNIVCIYTSKLDSVSIVVITVC
jgi:hypothetical protein